MNDIWNYDVAWLICVVTCAFKQYIEHLVAINSNWNVRVNQLNEISIFRKAKNSISGLNCFWTQAITLSKERQPEIWERKGDTGVYTLYDIVCANFIIIFGHCKWQHNVNVWKCVIHEGSVKPNLCKTL